MNNVKEMRSRVVAHLVSDDAFESRSVPTTLVWNDGSETDRPGVPPIPRACIATCHESASRDLEACGANPLPKTAVIVVI